MKASPAVVLCGAILCILRRGNAQKRRRPYKDDYNKDNHKKTCNHTHSHNHSTIWKNYSLVNIVCLQTIERILITSWVMCIYGLQAQAKSSSERLLLMLHFNEELARLLCESCRDLRRRKIDFKHSSKSLQEIYDVARLIIFCAAM